MSAVIVEVNCETDFVGGAGFLGFASWLPETLKAEAGCS